MGSKMSNPLTALAEILFGGGANDAGKKRQLETASEEDKDDPNDRWIPDYDDKRRRIYYYNPKRQEISWKAMPTRGNVSSSSLQRQQQLAQEMASLLPHGSAWAVAYDCTNGVPYYYNTATQETLWERPSTQSAAIVMVEYQNKSGLVHIADPITASFKSLRQEVLRQLDAADQYPSNREWSIQLLSETGNAVAISKSQEKDVGLLQTLLAQQKQLKVRIVPGRNTAAAATATNDQEERVENDTAATAAATAATGNNAAATGNNNETQGSPPGPSRDTVLPAGYATAPTTNQNAHHRSPPSPSNRNQPFNAAAALPPRAPPRQKASTPSAGSSRKQTTTTAAAASVVQHQQQTSTQSTARRPPPPPKRRTRSSSGGGNSDWTPL